MQSPDETPAGATATGAHLAVSVAMATFNGARHLQPQLDSLAAQHVLPYELVACDDGSSDDTVPMLEAFAQTAPFPVRVVRNPARLGYKGNFMRAAALCQGEVVAFSDQDDVWSRDKIGRLAGQFAQDEVTMVFHRAALIDAAGGSLGALRQERSAFVFPSFRAHSPFRFPLGFSIAVRRRLDAFSDLRARSIDFFKPDEPMAHDQWFSSLAFMLGRVVYLDEELVAYRQHSGALFGAGDGVLSPPPERTLAGWFTAEADYRPLASTLQALADCGAEIDSRLPAGEEGERARRHLDIARTELARLVELYRLRARAYSDGSLPSRALAWWRLLRGAAYAAGPHWRFHRKFLLRDLLAGVMAASLAGAAPDRLYGDRTLETPDPPMELGASTRSVQPGPEPSASAAAMASPARVQV